MRVEYSQVKIRPFKATPPPQKPFAAMSNLVGGKHRAVERACRAVGVARQFVQPSFSRTESKLVNQTYSTQSREGSQHAD